MARVSREEIERARRVDLLSYLERNEPTELVDKGHGHYSTRTHDSVDINNGMWYQWSSGIGGQSALDYLVKVRGVSFVDAVMQLNGQEINISPALAADKPIPKAERRLLLPQHSPDNRRAIKYLMSRGIDREIIDCCIAKGYIYESYLKHNVMFVGMDEIGEPRYAAYRSTDGNRILGDAAGSDKRYSFRFIGGRSSRLHIFESAIDALSYMTLVKKEGAANWRDGNFLSMAGVYASSADKLPAALARELESGVYESIYIHFDNDKPGRDATQSIGRALKVVGDYEVIDGRPPVGKDYNDFLCSKLAMEHRAVCEREADDYGR